MQSRIFQCLRLNFSRDSQEYQFWHVHKLSSIAEDHAASAEHHRTPEHQEQKRLGVEFV